MNPKEYDFANTEIIIGQARRWIDDSKRPLVQHVLNLCDELERRLSDLSVAYSERDAAIARIKILDWELECANDQLGYARDCAQRGFALYHAADATLVERDKPCEWRKDDPSPAFWRAGCGVVIYGNDAGFEYKFCPRCGHPIGVMP